MPRFAVVVVFVAMVINLPAYLSVFAALLIVVAVAVVFLASALAPTHCLLLFLLNF